MPRSKYGGKTAIEIDSSELHTLPFEELYEWIWLRVYPITVNRLRNRHDAEDIVMETAISTWRALEENRLEDPQSLQGYILRAAQFAAFQFKRTRSAHAKTLAVYYRPLLAIRPHEDEIIAKLSLKQALRELKPDYKEILLATASGVGYVELAERLGRTERSIANIAFKARAKMRELLSAKHKIRAVKP